jgi:hypothetical protein
MARDLSDGCIRGDAPNRRVCMRHAVIRAWRSRSRRSAKATVFQTDEFCTFGKQMPKRSAVAIDANASSARLYYATAGVGPVGESNSLVKSHAYQPFSTADAGGKIRLSAAGKISKRAVKCDRFPHCATPAKPTGPIHRDSIHFVRFHGPRCRMLTVLAPLRLSRSGDIFGTNDERDQR